MTWKTVMILVQRIFTSGFFSSAVICESSHLSRLRNVCLCSSVFVGSSLQGILDAPENVGRLPVLNLFSCWTLCVHFLKTGRTVQHSHSLITGCCARGFRCFGVVALTCSTGLGVDIVEVARKNTSLDDVVVIVRFQRWKSCLAIVQFHHRSECLLFCAILKFWKTKSFSQIGAFFWDSLEIWKTKSSSQIDTVFYPMFISWARVNEPTSVAHLSECQYFISFHQIIAKTMLARVNYFSKKECQKKTRTAKKFKKSQKS